MRALIAWWKSSPRVRFAARTIAVAVATYIVDSVRSGDPFTWGSLASGAGAATLTAIAGLLGLEPFVGVKPSGIEVPVPPAKPEPNP